MKKRAIIESRNVRIRNSVLWNYRKKNWNSVQLLLQKYRNPPSVWSSRHLAIKIICLTCILFICIFRQNTSKWWRKKEKKIWTWCVVGQWENGQMRFVCVFFFRFQLEKWPGKKWAWLFYLLLSLSRTSTTSSGHFTYDENLMKVKILLGLGWIGLVISLHTPILSFFRIKFNRLVFPLFRSWTRGFDAAAVVPSMNNKYGIITFDGAHACACAE